MKNTYYLLLLVFVTPYNTHATACSTSCDTSPEYTFEPEFRALILKPSANNLHYAVQATPLPLQSPDWNIFDIHPDYHFGFDIGTRAYVCNCDTFVSLNWTHFKSHTCAAQTVPTDTDMIGPFFEIGPDATPYKQAAGSVRFTFNAIDLTYGQSVDFSGCLKTHLFMGIHVVDLKQCISSFYQGADVQDSSSAIIRRITVPTSFIGAGPEFGCDLIYDICRNLNLVGRFKASILIGTAKNFTEYVSESPLLITRLFPSPNVQSTCVPKRSQVVPYFEERLGLAYFPPCTRYRIKLEAGFEARIYINPLQSIDMGSEVITLPFPAIDAIGVFARTFRESLSNFALAGPYVALSIAF